MEGREGGGWSWDIGGGLCVGTTYGVFFFSSRRRHTRCSRDWSSDVCSSDLVALWAGAGRIVHSALARGGVGSDDLLGETPGARRLRDMLVAVRRVNVRR